MNDAQAKALRRVLQRAVTRSADEGFPFFYCHEGDAGEPVLLVQRRLSPGDIRAVRRTAKKKKFVQGTVFGDGGQLVFQAPDHTAGQFPKRLRTDLGASVRALKKARVVGLDGEVDEPEDLPAAAPTTAPATDAQQDAEAQLDGALAQLDEAQGAADAAERARRGAQADLDDRIAAMPALAPLAAEAGRLDAAATEAAEQVLDLQEELTAAEVALEAQLAALDPVALDPHAAAALAELARAVTGLREQIRAESALAAGADAHAKEARGRLLAAVGAEPALDGARARLAGAEADLQAADDAESRAEDAVFAAEAACEDAARRALLAPAVAAAAQEIAAHAEALGALARINPRDASRKERKQIAAAGAEALLADLQAILDGLLAEGAALDDVRHLFDAVPSDWRPAALTEHMQWFQRLQGWEAAMDSAREAAAQQEEIEALLHGHDTDTARQAKRALQEHYREHSEHAPPSDLDVNDAAELLSLMKAAAAGAVQRPGDDPALAAEVQGIDGYDQAQDPVLKRMRDERMLELAAALGEEGVGWLALLATEAPGVALLFSGTNLAKELTQASLRVVKQVRTASLLGEAEEKDSVAVEALRQAKAREGLLALHHSIQTVSATFDVGTDLMVLSGGITLPLAFAVKIGTSIAANKIEELAVTDKERSIISRAEEHKEAALRGDPEAARKLFAYSKRYAKGMLAWLAISGDEIAQKYARMQGIPAEELAKTSPAVLQRYLLRAARELDEADKTPSWLAKVTQKLADILARIGDYLIRKSEAIDEYFSGAAKAMPELVPVSDRLLNTLDATLRDFARKRAFLAQRPLRNGLLILDLDEARDTFDREADALEQAVSDNLAWLGTRQDDVADEIIAAAEDRRAREAAEKTQARLEKAAAHNIALLQRLAALP